MRAAAVKSTRQTSRPIEVNRAWQRGAGSVRHSCKRIKGETLRRRRIRCRRCRRRRRRGRTSPPCETAARLRHNSENGNSAYEANSCYVTSGKNSIQRSDAQIRKCNESGVVVRGPAIVYVTKGLHWGDMMKLKQFY